MDLELRTPPVEHLTELLAALGRWQRDDDPFQLHPGDLGWFWRFGATTTAAATRTWDSGGNPLVVGLLDEPDVLRLAIAPEARLDDEAAAQVVDDLVTPGRVLPAGRVAVEAPVGSRVRALLLERGWVERDPRAPLRHRLASLPDVGLRIEQVEPATVGVRTAVQRAAFDRSTFTDSRWHAMAEGPAYADARCLVGYDDHGTAVAACTVWSAGPGRPGLLEPLGVHRDHRGHGFGTAIARAAAAALHALGASSALVNTASSNVVAVATYASAGFEPLPPVCDVVREA
ncbi:MAG: GNAT family N-acetyltransferase [Frankiales bacterium]|nr:GNAT family N-acetyltransferase [Frankiales bacterium]